MSSAQERIDHTAVRKRDEQQRRAATAAEKAAAKAELNEQKAQLEHGAALQKQRMQDFWHTYKVAPPAEPPRAPAPLTQAVVDVDVAEAS